MTRVHPSSAAGTDGGLSLQGLGEVERLCQAPRNREFGAGAATVEAPRIKQRTCPVENTQNR
jgi:hypothetical protein